MKFSLVFLLSLGLFLNFVYGLPFKSMRSILSTRGGAFGRNSDDDDDNNNNKSSKKRSSTSASIQYMITNKMRKTLVDELGYLNHEVNEMDPQIAAVLLEKRLPRPMNGMPSSWKRQGGSSGSFLSFRPLGSLFSRVASLLQGLSSTVSSHFSEIVPFALPLAAVLALASFVPQTLPALLAGLTKHTKALESKAKVVKTTAKEVSKKAAKKYRRRLQKITSDLHPPEFKTFLQKPSALARAKGQAGDVNIRNFERVAERKFSDMVSIFKNSLLRQ